MEEWTIGPNGAFGNQPQRGVPQSATRRRGFTLAELLIAVALLAVLLTAVAVATHGSLMANSENLKMASLNQTARVFLTRLRTEMRTAEWVDTGASTTSVSFTRPGTDANTYAYSYTADTKAMTYTRTPHGGSPVSQTIFEAASPVTLDRFIVTRNIDSSDPNDVRTMNVRVEATFSTDNQTLTTACSAAVRRNQDY